MSPVRRRRLLLLVAAAALAILPFVFFELHRIDGVSMWPAFADSSRILVRRDDARPERLAPVVLRVGARGGRTVLKRAIAFGGETVFVTDGDVLVNGAPIPRDLDQVMATAAPYLEIGDLALRTRGTRRIYTGRGSAEALLPIEGRAAVSEDGRFLNLTGDGGPTVVRIPAEDLRDDHESPRGRWAAGRELVVDPIVTFALHESGAGTVLRLEHVVDDEVRASLVLTPREGGVRVAVASVGGEDRAFELGRDEASRIRFALADDRRFLGVAAGDGAFRVLDEGARTPPRGARSSWLRLRVEGGEATFSRLDIARDIHYTSPQTEAVYGVREPFRVPEGQLFTLGDNSAESEDSRHWGAVELGDGLVGRPVAVVWPRARMRFVGLGAR
ncbi:MAG: S26 family signal peptidase [Planctomycetota bacterium]